MLKKKGNQIFYFILYHRDQYFKLCCTDCNSINNNKTCLMLSNISTLNNKFTSFCLNKN